MASDKLFVINTEKINKFVNGDLGIADNIHKVQVTPILDQTQTAEDKEIFAKLQEPNKKTGLWSVEKTFITSALENYKPFIEIIKVSLEMFGHLEYTVKLLTGGPNPLNQDDSFLGAFGANKEEQSKIKTGYEQNPVPEKPEFPPPTDIFLGYFRRNGTDGDVFALGSNGNEAGRAYNINDGNFVWPQYTDYNDFHDQEITKITPKIANLDDEMKKLILEGREDSIADEWSEMDSDKWLGGNKDDKKLEDAQDASFPPNLKFYYKSLEVIHNNEKVVVDIEEDYIININKYVNNNSDDYYQTFLVTARLNPNKSAVKKQGKPDPLSPRLLTAIRYFFNKALTVIINKFIPTLEAFKSVMKSPVEFLGNILMEKMKEHFELFDISIKDKDKYDKTRMKYWTFEDQFVLDGKNVMDVGIFKITIEIKDGKPSFKVGKEELSEDNKENPIIKTLTNLVAMPLNILKGILDIFINLFKSLFKVKQLPGVVSDFLTLKSFSDLMTQDKLLEFLGAQNGDVKTIPMLNIPTDGNLSVLPAVILAFLKFIIQFINGFLGIPNAILNKDLIPLLPIPS